MQMQFSLDLPNGFGHGYLCFLHKHQEDSLLHHDQNLVCGMRLVIGFKAHVAGVYNYIYIYVYLTCIHADLQPTSDSFVPMEQRGGRPYPERNKWGKPAIMLRDFNPPIKPYMNEA